MSESQPSTVQQSESQPTSNQQQGSVKETIESILVAFILAFIFRAFVVEAFVIPTGSMAPTLLGAHMRFQCPDCGYVFDVNYSHGDSEDTNFPSEDRPPDDIYCPNCGYKVASGPMHDNNGRPVLQPMRDAQGRQLVDADGNRVQQLAYPFGSRSEQVRFGDRILVLKYAYLFGPPHRWDVVVFKAPADPDKYHYTQNFIKRLVGEPGETLMVLDGSIFLQDADGDWKIQQKPADVLDAMWRVIYDNDYYPQGLPREDRSSPWTQPWKLQSGTGWDLGHNASDGRVFHFASQADGSIAFDASANPGTQTTNDYLVYDIPANQRRPDGASLPNGDIERSVVSDLKLSVYYQRTSGQGPLKLLLSKRDHVFTAEIDPDSATLWQTHPDGTTDAAAGPVKFADIGLSSSAPISLQLTNVDYRVTLWINGKDVLHTTDAQYSPDVDQLRNEFEKGAANPEDSLGRRPPRIEIIADNQQCSLSHVGLWRDIYYTNRTSNSGSLEWATPDRPVVLHHRGEKRADGTGAYDDDEYFVMGDNSEISGDARYWDRSIDLPYEGLEMESGRVPGRFLLGRAFFVYWPSGYRPISAFPAIIPNFGDMRFIH